MNTDNLKPIKLPRLLATIAYDLIIIIAILLLATTLLFFICLVLQINQPQPQSIYLRVYLFAVIVSYYHLSWTSHNHQTIGMKAWRVKLINNMPGDITLSQSILRVIGGVIGFVSFGLGYICLYFNKKQLTLADLLSNTKLYHVNN